MSLPNAYNSGDFNDLAAALTATTSVNRFNFDGSLHGDPSIDTFGSVVLPADAATAPSTVIDKEKRCRYPSKFCSNPRAFKKSGKLHSFCEFHRSKANRNQRRLEQRKRQRQLEEQQQHQSPETTKRRRFEAHQEMMDMGVEPSPYALALQPEDLEALSWLRTFF